MRKYFLFFGISALLTGAGMVGFNWLVDPYRIFGAPIIPGFNNFKTTIGKKERIFKTVNLARQKPEVILLGTSRTGWAINPLHPVFRGKKALNLAMNVQPYLESKMLLEYLELKQNNTVVFGIDFFPANVFLRPPHSFTPENFTTYRKFELLLSFSTLIDSIATIGRIGLATMNVYTDEGMRILDRGYAASGSNVRRYFLESEQAYLAHLYSPAPKCSFEFDAVDTAQSPMENVRAILSRAYLEKIDLRLFISPSHAMQWETLAAAGLWNKWEEWKYRLVKMNEDEAAKVGSSPFPVWDFSGYNSISTETVPALDDTKVFMRNYFDSSHYTPEVGNLVLDRMFDYHAPDRTVPDDFGVRITSVNLDTHLARIRLDREHYRRTHPNDIAEIETLAKKVAAEKYCANLH